MGAHEALEHAEHTGHAHGSRQMGVTMAILGVLIAFSAAMVGSQRQELMTTLLDQSWAHSSWVGAVVKEEMVVTDLQKMRTQPNVASDPALARLIRMDEDYTTETDLAKEWDDVSDPLIEAHFDAAEGYEHAQLIAEVALIIASIAILLSNRMAWYASVVVGAVSLAFIGFTFFSARGEIAKHHEKVLEAEEDYVEHSESDLDSKGREELLKQLDPDGKIRATVSAESKHDTEEYKQQHAKHGEQSSHSSPAAAKPEQKEKEDEKE